MGSELPNAGTLQYKVKTTVQCRSCVFPEHHKTISARATQSGYVHKTFTLGDNFFRATCFQDTSNTCRKELQDTESLYTYLHTHILRPRTSSMQAYP